MPKHRSSKKFNGWHYCHFHLGDFSRAKKVYERILHQTNDSKYHLMIACCNFHLRSFLECIEEALKGPICSLRSRVLIQTYDKLGMEEQVLSCFKQLGNSIEEQMCLASLHFRRRNYQDSVDIYKKILKDNNDFLALKVYLAMCYYKIDYSDISQDFLNEYLQKYPESLFSINLKSCNLFKMLSAKIALGVLEKSEDFLPSSRGIVNLLIEHNLAIFREGEKATKILPSLGVIPEARLNLVIYYLHQEELRRTYELIKDFNPTTKCEYVLKGVVLVMIGEEERSPKYLKQAMQIFRLIGLSDCGGNSIPEKQCMVYVFFHIQQFRDSVIYLKSIEEFFQDCSRFHWNYGIARAASDDYQIAERELLQVNDSKMLTDFVYLSWLARSFVLNGTPSSAWEIFLKMERQNDMEKILWLLGNDYYRVGEFMYSAKAFDVLERLDPSNPSCWKAKKGACVGCFQQIIARERNCEELGDVIHLLEKSKEKEESDRIVNIMKKWASDNNVNFRGNFILSKMVV